MNIIHSKLISIIYNTLLGIEVIKPIDLISIDDGFCYNEPISKLIDSISDNLGILLPKLFIIKNNEPFGDMQFNINVDTVLPHINIVCIAGSNYIKDIEIAINDSDMVLHLGEGQWSYLINVFNESSSLKINNIITQLCALYPSDVKLSIMRKIVKYRNECENKNKLKYGMLRYNEI